MAQRCADARDKLRTEYDAWVASSDQHGGPPYLTPLSFLWDGGSVIVACEYDTVTGRNLETTGRTRIAVGSTRDVVMIDGVATALRPAELDTGEADAFALRAGFDPRQLTDRYRYFRIVPDRIQSWREAGELAGRLIYRDGHWSDGGTR